jgi:histidinol-phosphatase
VTADAPAEFGPDWSAGLRRGTDDELRGWVDAALAWCDETDRLAMASFRRDVAVERKPDTTFVTEADRGIERLLRDRIVATFAGHGVVGEEYGADVSGASVRWILDPIDGTHNYIRGIPLFGTLIGIERDGELQAGVISAPALGERWYGWRGGGAWVTGQLRGAGPQRIATSRIAMLSDAQIVFASAGDMERSGIAPGFQGLLAEAWRERAFGDFWGYTLVAEGAAEAMVESDLKIWDAAAPTLIVEEAGGRVTDFDGRRATDPGTIVATNGHLHEVVLQTLHRGGETAT